MTRLVILSDLHGNAAATEAVLLFGHTHVPWTLEIEGVRFINTGSMGKPKDGDPRAGWVLLTIDPDGTATSELRWVDYDVVAMAAGISAAGGLPDHFARY